MKIHQFIVGAVVFLSSLILMSPLSAYAGGGSVSFVGNQVIDYKGFCAWGSGYTGATIIIKKDGQEVYRSSTLTSENSVEAYYRDSGLSPGESHEYMTCCDYEGGWSDEISCPAYGSTATAGEVGGTLEQDLEMTGAISLDTYIKVKPGTTLSIDSATVELAPDGYSGWISGDPDTEQTGYGTLQINNSTLSSDIRTYFRSSGDNLFTNNMVLGENTSDEQLHIDGEASVTISGNTFINVGIDVEDDSTAEFILNSFSNSELYISDYQGRPNISIENNEFSNLERGTNIYIQSADVTITNNTISGRFSEQYNRYAATGIFVGSSNSGTPAQVALSGNQLSGYGNAIQVSSDSKTTITGNIFSGNDTGLYSNQTAATTLTGNTFIENERAIEFSDGSLTMSNNCIAGNDRGLMHTYSDSSIAASQNWWGAATGPENAIDNPEGTGDIIYNPSNTTGRVNFTPWLTASNCQDVPTPPEPEPATLTLLSDVEELPADGQSTAELTLTLTDENGLPVSGAEILFRSPDYGQLSALSGTTDGTGQLEVTYTTADATDLSGIDYVELIAEYPAEEVSDSLVISFRFASANIWATPTVSPYPSETAIIPGDSRFPALYLITLRDTEGQPVVDQEVTLSIPDSGRARLEAGGQAGRQIVATTDAGGEIEARYVYLGSPDFSAPLEDIISITSDVLQESVEAKVSVGLNIDITEINTPQNSNSLPKALAMRMQLEDAFRPQMDLRAYLSALEDASGQQIGMAISTQWLNPPEPRFLDSLRTVFPNMTSTTPPDLYQGSGVINYGDIDFNQVIVEALDSPNLSYGANTYPAITFHEAGNYWFGVYAEPILLGPFGTASDYLKGAKEAGLGRIFGASVLDGAESVFQSVVCSVKPTTKAQFVAHTLYVSNPWFQIVPPVAALNLVTKASSIICDAMQGNYATAAINMASLSTDSLQYAYETGHLDLTLEQFLKLGKLIKVNQTFSRLDNLNSANDQFSSDVSEQQVLIRARSNIHAAAAESPFLASSWPDDLELDDYRDIIDTIESGELSADSSLSEWQSFGIISDGEVSLVNSSSAAESFSSDELHVFLAPWEDSSLSIETSGSAEIHRYYRVSERQVYTATYNYSTDSSSALLNLPLQGVSLDIDEGADGTKDTILTPQINSVDTTLINLNLETNQQIYHPGDTFTLTASLNNPGEAIAADVYFTVQDSFGNLLSLPDLSPGHTPLATQFFIEKGLEINDFSILSFPVTEAYSGIGTYTLEAFLAYPGTMDLVGGFKDAVKIRFEATLE